MSHNILPLIPPELLQYTLLHEASLASRPDEETSLLRFFTKPGHTFGEGYRRIYIGVHPDDDYAYVGDASSSNNKKNSKSRNQRSKRGPAAGPSSARTGFRSKVQQQQQQSGQIYNNGDNYEPDIDDVQDDTGDEIDDSRSFLVGIDTLWQLEELYNGNRKGKGRAHNDTTGKSGLNGRPDAVTAETTFSGTRPNGHLKQPVMRSENSTRTRAEAEAERESDGSSDDTATATDTSSDEGTNEDGDDGSSMTPWRSAQSSLRNVKKSLRQKPLQIDTKLAMREVQEESGSSSSQGFHKKTAGQGAKKVGGDDDDDDLGSPDGLFKKLSSKDDKKRLSSGDSGRRKTPNARGPFPQDILSRRALDSPMPMGNGSVSGILSEDSKFVGLDGLRSVDKKVSDNVREEVRQLSNPAVEPEMEKRHELLRRVSDTLLPETASDTFVMSSGNRNDDLLAPSSALKRPDARKWKSSKSVTWNTSHGVHSTFPATKAMQMQLLPQGSGDEPASDPSKVLSRPDPLEQPAEETPPDIPTIYQLTRTDTSESIKALGKLAATKEASLPPGVEKLERMLIRACWTSREGFPDEFDETAARTFPLRWTVWEEVAVIWKRHHLEIYGTHRDPFHRFLTKSLDLRFVIPLNNTRTRLSVYSMADQIFCIRCPPHPLGGRHRSGKSGLRNKRHIHTEGTNLFLFRARATTIAQDWYLGLHMALKKVRIDSLEVHLPGLGIRIRLPTNAEAHDTATPSVAVTATRDLMNAGLPNRNLVSKDEMLQSIRDLVSNRSDWKELLDGLEKRHIALRLAWRKGPIMEWLSFDRSVDGVRRIWDVYTGAIMKQATEAVHRLEAIPEIHHPTYVSLANGVHLLEPPSVEGFISRLRYRNEGQRERLYLGTFGRVLYIFRSSKAQLPVFPKADHPPHADDGVNKPATDVRAAELLKAYEEQEYARLASMLVRCRGVILLRDIKTVELDDTCQHCADAGSDSTLKARPLPLKKTQDHNHLIVQITLADDKKFRFETTPKEVAREWVGRLSALVEYWTKRERADAKVQLALSAYPSSQKLAETKITEMLPFQRRELEDSATKTDLDEELLSQAFHFCIQKGCRYNIRMQGRLYYKKGHRDATFFDRFIVLVGNHLMIFETFRRNFSKRPVPLVYHRRLKTIHLKDVYLVTGEGCSQFFRDVGRTGYNPSQDQNSLARVYKDGLISVDDPMDCTLMLWRQRRKATTTQLGKHGKAYLFRARSKLERDQWVQAFNVMCEEYGRTTREREIRLATFSQIK